MACVNLEVMGFTISLESCRPRRILDKLLRVQGYPGSIGYIVRTRHVEKSPISVFLDNGAVTDSQIQRYDGILELLSQGVLIADQSSGAAEHTQ